jgi:hypothetical protein
MKALLGFYEEFFDFGYMTNKGNAPGCAAVSLPRPKT